MTLICTTTPTNPTRHPPQILLTLIRICAQPLSTSFAVRTIRLGGQQGGITCEAIDEPRKSSYAIDERVIINFRDKNVVIARFRDKNGGFILFIYIYVLSITFLFFR